MSVTTPGVTTMQELADSEGIEVDCLGGRLRSPSQSFVGPLAEDGICEAGHAQTRLKELMARRGNVVYVLADSSKLGLRPFHAWARLALPWTLVTDDGADPGQVRSQGTQGLRLKSLRYCPAGVEPCGVWR